MDRFDVVVESTYCWVRDTQYKVHGSDKRAVAVNFRTVLRADLVCNMLNAEWREFERNPY